LKQDDETVSEGLNQIFEIINAKGDEGELKEIVDKSKASSPQERDEIEGNS
jgi:hypothetical protein